MFVPTSKQSASRCPTSGRRSRLWHASSVALVVMLALASPASGDEVQVRAALHTGFGRLVLEWPRPMDVLSRLAGNKLVLSFSEPLEADYAEALAQLASYLLAIEPGAAVNELRVELRPGMTAQVSTLNDRIVVIEFSPATGTVSTVDVRTGRHDGFERIVFDWPEPVRFRVHQDGGRLAIEFARPGWIDAGALQRRLPWTVARARAEAGTSSSYLLLDLQPQVSAELRQYKDDQVVLDLTMPVNSGPKLPASAASFWWDDVRPAGSPGGASWLDGVTAGQAATSTNSTGPAPVANRDAGSTEPELEALNRVLVESGGLLLPAWKAEIAPSLKYTHRGANGLLITDVAGERRVTSQSVRRDTVEAAATVRLGLPWSFQGEVRIPYLVSQEKVAVGGMQTEINNGSGLGDIEVGLTHQFLRESGFLPDLLGEVRWRTTTGKDSFKVTNGDLAVGTGFHGVSGTLTAVKSYDPLVFLGSISYTANLPDQKNGFDIDPGDTFSFGIGAILAAGPGTSIRLGINQSFTGEVELDGREVAGSDQVSGVLEIGASAALPWRTLLDVTAGIGITEDAPDLALRLSLPYRL